jgi:hypothetical protein
MKEEMLTALLKYFKGKHSVSGHAFNQDTSSPYTLKEVLAEFKTYEAAVKAVKVYEQDIKGRDPIARAAALNKKPAPKAAPKVAPKPKVEKPVDDLAARAARKLEELNSGD